MRKYDALTLHRFAKLFGCRRDFVFCRVTKVNRIPLLPFIFTSLKRQRHFVVESAHGFEMDVIRRQTLLFVRPRTACSLAAFAALV